jgi:hypothetical protein
MKLRLKRWLYLVHRWFGVAMCLLFAMWFATGIVMMYVEYPELTEEERLAALPPLDYGRVTLSVEDAVAASGLGEGVATVVLASIGERPVYRLRSEAAGVAALYADDGSRFAGHSPASAVAAVQRSGFAAHGALATYERTVDVDQWTVSAALDEHRPLYRVAIGDERGTVVYVSDETGQIVTDTDRRERFWNWLGSTLHWIYPYQLRRHAKLWTNLQIYLSVASLVSVATGAVVGLLRLRLRRPYRGRDASPYAGAAKWHHVLGLLSLFFLATFTFSGLMSMTPWGLFDSVSSEAEQVRRFTHAEHGDVEPWTPMRSEALARGPAVKEIEWRRVAGLSHAVVSRTADDREVVIDGAASAQALAKLRARVQAAAQSLIPGATIVGSDVVSDYDDYYYSRHNRYRPLPAYRVEFDDREATWFYVDWTTGAVVLRYTAAGRVQRWLYNGLHSLDFSFLTRHGALWDATVIALCCAGFVFAVTALVVAWRRVARVGHHVASLH